MKLPPVIWSPVSRDNPWSWLYLFNKRDLAGPTPIVQPCRSHAPIFRTVCQQYKKPPRGTFTSYTYFFPLATSLLLLSSMSSISAYSPTFEQGFHSPRETIHSAHYWPSSGLYNIENCVNCGHRYDLKNSKYDLNGDATMPWRNFSAIVAEHYRSCPKKLA